MKPDTPVTASESPVEPRHPYLVFLTYCPNCHASAELLGRESRDLWAVDHFRDNPNCDRIKYIDGINR